MPSSSSSSSSSFSSSAVSWVGRYKQTSRRMQLSGGLLQPSEKRPRTKNDDDEDDW
jgi:hypothetical protein